MNLPNRTSPGSVPGLIAPKLAIVAGIVITVVSLYLLTPSRSELFQRHMIDGDAKSASLHLAQKKAGNSSGIVSALTAETIAFCQRKNWEKSSLTMLTSFLRNNSNFKPAAQETLRQLDQLPGHVRGSVLGAIVERSVADGDLAFAAEVQTRLLESIDRLTPGIVEQAVKTYRYNSNPALALLAIDALAKQDGSLPIDLRELRIVLARETSQPDLAFALINQRVRATKDPLVLRELIPTAIKTGAEAGRQKELIPLYEKYLESAASGPAASFPLASEYALKLAQTYEWTGQPSKAFDAYIKLAGQGNRPALDRCIALNAGLFRQEEVMEALVAGYDHYRGDEKLLLLTARYLGDAALREESIRFYLEYLERKPEDAEAHYQLGAIYDEAVRFKEGFAQFRKAHELDPGNDAYLLKAARLATTLRHYDEALGYYQVLSRRTRDRDHAEQFYTLAGGLGDTKSTKEALRLLIDIGGRLTRSNYLYLAAEYRDDGDVQGTLNVLREANKKHPKSPFIRTELAQTLLLIQRPDLALDALTGVNLTAFPQAGEAALHALTSLARSPYASGTSSHLRRIGNQLEACKGFSAAELLLFAEVCKQNGDTGRSRRLLQRLTASDSDAGQLAVAYYHLGKLRSARDQQIKHIKSLRLPKSSDYQMLGDIHTKLGETASARKAYQKALSLLQKSTANHR